MNRYGILRALFAALCLLLCAGNANAADTFSQTAPPKEGDTIAIIKTNQGVMKAVIFTGIVPESAKNFIDLAKAGKYSNTPFHRIIKGFMIQGGDFTNQNGSGGYAAAGPDSTIADQYSPELSHIHGALSWAKTSAPHSIGSQFFIVHGKGGAHFLDHRPGQGSAEGYSVFGQLYDGLDVLDKIGDTPTAPGDKPLTPMTIESVTIEKFTGAAPAKAGNSQTENF